MVVVLPWHDPIRVVEEASMLDNLLQGRQLRLGVGRGAAKLEFDGLGIEMDSSRERSLEALAVGRQGPPGAAAGAPAASTPDPARSDPSQPRNADIVDQHVHGVGKSGIGRDRRRERSPAARRCPEASGMFT